MPSAGEGTEAKNTLVPLAVRRAQDGDRDAFAFLYARFADDVYLHVRRILGDHDEAQDAVQCVFERLTHAVSTYEERHGPFLHWVLRLARCVAGEHLCQSSSPIDERQVAVHEIATWSAPPAMPR